jgi:hypothetical protein
MYRDDDSVYGDEEVMCSDDDVAYGNERFCMMMMRPRMVMMRLCRMIMM